MTNVLVLAGTSLARQLCQRLAGANKWNISASLAGETRNPEDLGVPTRIGGFGGETGFSTYLKSHDIRTVIDATHPFADQMTATAYNVCKRQGARYALLQKPEWLPADGDNWHTVDHAWLAESLIPAGARVFLGTGRKTLKEFVNLADLSARRWLSCRVIDPPLAPFPFENGEFVVGKPPFSAEEEIAFFRHNRIDWIVVKNAGTSLSFSKLEAARQLQIPVVMINRPKLPNATLFHDVSACKNWLENPE